MPEFLELVPPDIALERLYQYIQSRAVPEVIETASALDRVTFSAVVAPHDLPMFSRSTVDGYALRAEDSFGARESLPAYLKLEGEVLMGRVPTFKVSPGACALIHTGGMLPEGTNAVVMLENTQLVKESEIEILYAVAPGENVILAGEDVHEGEQVLPAGCLIRPAEIGGLMALGITQVTVSKRPIVGIISTGDEVVHPKVDPKPGQVRDINSYTMSSLVEKAKGTPRLYGIISDKADELEQVARSALHDCDLLLITAGSSASARDITVSVIQKLGEPGVLVHGIGIRPGKPTILAACQPGSADHAKPVIGLPGNPVSAYVIATLFVQPVIDYLAGIRQLKIRPWIEARLSMNLASQAGREDWVSVHLEETQDGWIAHPIFSKSNLIFSLVRAQGLAYIPPEATGSSAGESIKVLIL